MRFRTPEIDRDNGRIRAFDDLDIGADARPEDFPEADFEKEDDTREGVVYTALRPRQRLLADGCVFQIDLHFEDGRLRVVQIAVTPAEHAGMNADDYYASGEQRHAFHREWLRRRLGEGSRFAWGEAEARWERRSEGVAIRLLYR